MDQKIYKVDHIRPEQKDEAAFAAVQFKDMSKDEKDDYLKQPIKMYWEEQDG